MFLVTIRCTTNVRSSSMAIGNTVLPKEIARLSSVSKTANSMSCSGGIEDSEYYSFSSKKLIEELVSIKIETILLTSLSDTRYCCSCRSWL